MSLAPEPLGFRCEGFSPSFSRTHSGILTSHRSTATLPGPLQCYGNAPLPLGSLRQLRQPVASATSLRVPTIIRADALDW